MTFTITGNILSIRRRLPGGISDTLIDGFDDNEVDAPYYIHQEPCPVPRELQLYGLELQAA
ncbi:MAG TPA: hypothetical protein VIP27_10250 [Variovorax sp.]